ncbi:MULTISPECIES: hypothetical protein [unclassified Streptomyces]|uniref:hypothetical protein n=1 Tax=unclassified Streptomyces TaxID=2593676 RepID=UPI0023652057|nr:MULTISPECIES: hypothetical protein [unclassified Streptomyces]MDF3146281.1 hypothetical protein [Streptomyces sp. T21Q-yed]WDF35719.1 hypothetical protein PBV52_02335 [Streptomyces sp. T12]
MPGIPPDAVVRLDAQVFLDVHPAHPTAVLARLTGSHYGTAQALLAAHGFDSLDERTMVLARIDHEEPYWAQKATHALHAAPPRSTSRQAMCPARWASVCAATPPGCATSPTPTTAPAPPSRTAPHEPRTRRTRPYPRGHGTFRGRYVPQTQAAVKAAVDGGDSRVSFVDTTGWLGSGDLTDSVHPNDQGHRVIADRLAPVIAARIGM